MLCYSVTSISSISLMHFKNLLAQTLFSRTFYNLNRRGTECARTNRTQISDRVMGPEKEGEEEARERKRGSPYADRLRPRYM